MESIAESVINVNFNNAMTKANELEEIADQIRQLASQRYDDTLNTLSGSWKGDSAELFVRKGVQLEEEMTKTADELRAVASAIRNSASRIKQAELKALEIATGRSYSSSW